MEYKNIDSQHILVRLDPNDEIVTSLMQALQPLSHRRRR